MVPVSNTFPQFFTFPERGKKAKPASSGSLRKLGKSSCGSHPLVLGEGRRTPLTPTHKRRGGPGARLAGEGWQSSPERCTDQGIGSDSLGVIYCQALFPNVLIKLQPNKCTSLRSCLCSSTAKTIEYYFQVKQE